MNWQSQGAGRRSGDNGTTLVPCQASVTVGNSGRQCRQRSEKRARATPVEMRRRFWRLYESDLVQGFIERRALDRQEKDRTTRSRHSPLSLARCQNILYALCRRPVVFL
ncbi:hypothetical protein ElyMa_000100000 [Elysia marginata]|uniref:Uncharacterized protein n=1 Tax=Elysia marginata TaxID=1093978 RepID=A0AAV4EJW4_9GAST|nr:hypothetical protein ElyMa_000100000 [Elysia marginata]